MARTVPTQGSVITNAGCVGPAQSFTVLSAWPPAPHPPRSHRSQCSLRRGCRSHTAVGSANLSAHSRCSTGMNKPNCSLSQKELWPLAQRLPRTRPKVTLCCQPWNQVEVERSHCEKDGSPQMRLRRPRVKCLPATLSRVPLALVRLAFPSVKRSAQEGPRRLQHGGGLRARLNKAKGCRFGPQGCPRLCLLY